MPIAMERLIDLAECCLNYRNAALEMRRIIESDYLQAKSELPYLSEDVQKHVHAVFNNLLIYTDPELVIKDYNKTEIIFKSEYEHINRNKARNARLKEKARAKRDSLGPHRKYKHAPRIVPGRINKEE